MQSLSCTIMYIESLSQPFLPIQLQAAHIALFTSVSNAVAIRAQIIAAANGTAADQDAVNFAFVNAKLVSVIAFRDIRR